MEWKKKLKEQVGVIDEGNIVNLNDMEDRELLSEESLNKLFEDPNKDIASGDSAV